MVHWIRRFLFLDEHTCPWWVIRSFDNPLRCWFHKPENILTGLVHPGQTVLDVGCGIGYFTLPLARMIGENGTVIAADLQSKMLTSLRQRAVRSNLLNRIQLVQSTPQGTGITIPVDFTLAFWMVHEVQNKPAFFNEIHGLLKLGAQMLVVEPIFHVTAHQFIQMIHIAIEQGFRASDGPPVNFSRSILLIKEE